MKEESKKITTYLVQRGNFENRDFKKGIDTIVSFQYMGSSEYEWGALPESLRRIRGGFDKYTYMDIPIKDKTITVFLKEEHLENILEYLKDLSENNFRLQERSDFDTYINPSKHFKCNTDFWWDLENDIMFWKENEEFKTKFKKLIKNQ